MKKILFVFLFAASAAPLSTLACDVCEKNQPAALRGITHGPGPDSNWDLLIIGCAAVIVLLTLIYSIRYLVRPGEQAAGHIKNIVIEN